MALYARTLLTRDTPRARSLILSLLLSWFRPSMLLLTYMLPSLHPAFTDAPFPPRCTRCALVSSSFSNFPHRDATAFVLFLRYGGAFEYNHQPAAVLVSLFLSLFFVFPRDLIRCNGAHNATVEERNRSYAFTNLLSTRWIYVRAVFTNKSIRN